jgi:hypothetical protein
MRCNRGNNKIHLFPATSEIRGIIGREEASRSLCLDAANRFAGRARSWGTPGPANVAKSTRRGSEEGVNRKKITPRHV